MPQYEAVCVVKSDAQGERLNKITDKVKKVLGDFKVENFNQSDWGIRKLAYPIEKHKTGLYLYFTFNGTGNVVSELERQLNYDDAVLRYLTMKVEKGGKIDYKPDNFQFAKTEAESFGHPFGGPDRRGDRRDRGGFRDRDDRGGFRGGDRNESREPRETKAEE